jgi:hypothetical protein
MAYKESSLFDSFNFALFHQEERSPAKATLANANKVVAVKRILQGCWSNGKRDSAIEGNAVSESASRLETGLGHMHVADKGTTRTPGAIQTARLGTFVVGLGFNAAFF